MKKKILCIKLTLLLFTIPFYAQEIERETFESDGVKTTISGKYTGMYDGSDSKKAIDYFNKAADFSKEKNYKNAEKFYKKAIKEDPEFVEAYDNLGRLYRALGQYDNAISQYKKSIELYPLGVMAHQNLGVVYNITEQFDKAEDCYQLLIDMHPKNAEGYFGKANALLRQEKYKQALSYIKPAIEIYEKEDSHHLGDGYYVAALCYLSENKIEEAKKYVELARAEGNEIDPRLDKAIELAEKPIEEKQPTEEQSTELSLKFDTEEDYKEQEPFLVKAVTWLEQTPVNEDKEDRAKVNAYILKWLTGVPYIGVVLDEKTIAFGEKCPQCLGVFMGSWAKHAIETKEYSNQQSAALAATESVIRFYNKNKTNLKKNSEIEKLIKLKNKGKLKDLFKHLDKK